MRERRIVGYDHRYASDAVAAASRGGFFSTGTPVWLTDRPCPTPAVSYLCASAARRVAWCHGGATIPTAGMDQVQSQLWKQRLPSIVAQIENELSSSNPRTFDLYRRALS